MPVADWRVGVCWVWVIRESGECGRDFDGVAEIGAVLVAEVELGVRAVEQWLAGQWLHDEPGEFGGGFGLLEDKREHILQKRNKESVETDQETDPADCRLNDHRKLIKTKNKQNLHD